MASRTILLVFALALVACDKPNKDEFLGDCGLHPTAPSLSPAATAPVLVDSLEVTAMNQMDFEMDAQLPPPQLAPMRQGPCTAGVVFRRDLVDTGPELSYLDLSSSTPETVLSGTFPDLELSLFYETDCTPVILQGDGDDWIQHTRTATGWTAAPVGLDLTAFPDASAWIGTITADVTSDGTWHLIATSGDALIHATRAPAPGSEWSFTSHTQPPGTIVDHVRVDASGALHALYRKTEYPCDPCDVHMYYGLLPAGSTEWTTLVMQHGEWGPPLDEFASTPWMELMGTRPLVAAHFQRRVVTGSFQSTELRVYAYEDGAFCTETVATRTDSYQGSDGDQFTGALPIARVDSTGRVHVAFLDQSIWHDSSGWMNEIRGQLRFASRGDDGWTLTTLITQPGQTESPSPLVGYGAPHLLASDDGALTIAGVQHTWDTDSIYNDTDVPVTYDLHLITIP